MIGSKDYNSGYAAGKSFPQNAILRCLPGNTIYMSLAEAANDTGMEPSRIMSAVANNKMVDGFYFECMTKDEYKQYQQRKEKRSAIRNVSRPIFG